MPAHSAPPGAPLASHLRDACAAVRCFHRRLSLPNLSRRPACSLIGCIVFRQALICFTTEYANGEVERAAVLKHIGRGMSVLAEKLLAGAARLASWAPNMDVIALVSSEGCVAAGASVYAACVCR